MFKKLSNFIFETRVKSCMIGANFMSIPEIVSEENILMNPDALVNATLASDNVYGFKNGDTYDFYYNRIHMHIINKEGIFGVEVYVSAEENAWSILPNNKGYITDSPDVKKFKVYTWSEERLLSGRFVEDELYISGSWNQYVNTNFRTLINSIYNCQENVRFDTIFKNISA